MSMTFYNIKINSYMIWSPTTREQAMHCFSWGRGTTTAGVTGFHPTKTHLEGEKWYADKLSF